LETSAGVVVLAKILLLVAVVVVVVFAIVAVANSDDDDDVVVVDISSCINLPQRTVNLSSGLTATIKNTPYTAYISDVSSTQITRVKNRFEQYVANSSRPTRVKIEKKF